MRKDSAGPETESTTAMWEGLEGVVREKAQEFIQQILEEEVTELLGREKSERKAAVDAAPPECDEQLEEMRTLSQTSPRALEAEARQLLKEERDSTYISMAYGLPPNPKSYRREDRLLLVSLVMGHEWFDGVAAPIRAEATESFRDLEHRLAQPRVCERCGEKARFRVLDAKVCDQCSGRADPFGDLPF